MANIITSEEYKKWVKEYDSDDPLVVLMTITHPTLSEPVRISSDATKFIQLDSETQEPIYGTVSRDNTYYALPFRFILPDQPETTDSSVRATLAIDNVNRDYTDLIRNVDVSPTLTIELCFASAPDTIIETLPVMMIEDIEYDVRTINLQLTIDDPRVQTFPALQFYPSRFPGLFS